MLAYLCDQHFENENVIEVADAATAKMSHIKKEKVNWTSCYKDRCHYLFILVSKATLVKAKAEALKKAKEANEDPVFIFFFRRVIKAPNRLHPLLFLYSKKWTKR